MNLRRRTARTALALSLIAAAGTLTGPARADLAAAQSSHPAARHVEWGKTVLLGQERALSAQATPQLTGRPVTCYNGVAHPVSYGGVDQWFDKSLASRGITAVVEYLWCPLSQSDTVGVNFSMGYVEITNGLWAIVYGSIGDYPASYTWDGASIHHNGCVGCQQAPDYYGDGMIHHVTYSPTDDFSEAGRGDWQWSAQFWVEVVLPADGASFTLSAISPTF